MAFPDARSGCCVPALVRAWVDQLPSAEAVVDPVSGESITYQQLWHLSGGVAAELAELGVARGEIVAVGGGRSVGMVVAMLGIARAGAAYLPLDAHAPAERLSALLEEAGTRFLVGGGPDLPGVRRVVVGEGKPFNDNEIDQDDPFYVNYTSGSTGRPKGVVVPHRAVVRLVSNPVFCTIEPGDRVANQSNPAFDATTFELWNTLTSGGTVVVLPSITELRIDDWIALVRDSGIATMFLTTSLFHLVARERPAALRALKTVIAGGEQMDLAATRRVLESGPPARLVNGYGPTETTTFATYYDCTLDSLAGLDRVPVGFPLQDTTLHLVEGELCIGGPGVALGYLHRPELTAERFVPDPVSGKPMYRTGDLARELPNGALELLGRRDRQVKLRGFRIELEEIEQAVLATGLADSAFVEKVGEGPAASLVGFVLPRSTVDGAMISDALRAKLPAYMVPARWVLLTELPYGPTGKVDRTRLLSQISADSVVSETDEAAPTDVTEHVGLIWREVLGVPGADPADNFIDSGGNSILAIQLASRLRERLAIDLGPTDVLLADSLAELAERVRDEVAAR
ncbi:non-ribosomal peptide synthetase [Lentzea aerocolonigenes]|uniref:non-ribosomal peptide synthetase n=1 Tax=Lentzea aerocolonigenes TaxID=68170 RepID=UPI001F25C56B|nr:non-ribosomal peptide synthetase [Lentzea aerocolonigenes]